MTSTGLTLYALAWRSKEDPPDVVLLESRAAAVAEDIAIARQLLDDYYGEGAWSLSEDAAQFLVTAARAAQISKIADLNDAEALDLARTICGYVSRVAGLKVVTPVIDRAMAAVDAIRRYAADLNAREAAPTGDDFNRLLDLAEGAPYAAPALQDVLEALVAQNGALKTLDALASALSLADGDARDLVRPINRILEDAGFFTSHPVAARAGWDLFQCSDGLWRIQRDDEAGAFQDDPAALAHVRALAEQGDDDARAALARHETRWRTDYAL